VAKIKPIKCKAHGRKEATLFSLGLQTLRKIFVRPHKNALDLIRQNLMASKTPRKALLLKALPT
jgi:hypothetical protein